MWTPCWPKSARGGRPPSQADERKGWRVASGTPGANASRGGGEEGGAPRSIPRAGGNRLAVGIAWGKVGVDEGHILNMHPASDIAAENGIVHEFMLIAYLDRHWSSLLGINWALPAQVRVLPSAI